MLFDWIDSSTGELINYNQENTQVMIGDISFLPDGKLTLKHPASIKAAAIPAMPYNSVFWAENELGQRIPYDEKITTDLENRGGPLEEQFQNNGRN